MLFSCPADVFCGFELAAGLIKHVSTDKCCTVMPRNHVLNVLSIKRGLSTHRWVWSHLLRADWLVEDVPAVATVAMMSLSILALLHLPLMSQTGLALSRRCQLVCTNDETAGRRVHTRPRAPPWPNQGLCGSPSGHWARGPGEFASAKTHLINTQS